jgi:hypothetical protein
MKSVCSNLFQLPFSVNLYLYVEVDDDDDDDDDDDIGYSCKLR